MLTDLAHFDQAQETALATKGKFHLAISGGSLPVMLAKHLVGRTDDLVKWPTWYVAGCAPPRQCRVSHAPRCRSRRIAKLAAEC